jgi:formate dehydrogenase major subunit
MAECHPVGFQWVTEAKMRGATVIHVDPRFTRTSATATKHVPIRVGLGHRACSAPSSTARARATTSTSASTSLAYTNAATLISEDFRDTEDLDGIFSGYDPKTGAYDLRSWAYAEADGGDGPADDADPTGRRGH